MAVGFSRLCMRPLLCLGYLKPAPKARDSRAYCRKPYTLSEETHEGFTRNPIPFQRKPYTLLSKTHEGFAENPIPFCQKPTRVFTETLYPFSGEVGTGRRSAGCWQAVWRAYPERGCPFFIASSVYALIRFYAGDNIGLRM